MNDTIKSAIKQAPCEPTHRRPNVSILSNQDEDQFVPEVDVASLQGALQEARDSPAPQPVESQSTETPAAHPSSTAASALPDDPEQALRALPPTLKAHIQDLITEAEAEGYLRGRNEQIEATQHFDSSDDDCDLSPTPIPHYARRSLWDF